MQSTFKCFTGCFKIVFVFLILALMDIILSLVMNYASYFYVDVSMF